jgi:hypothetical protein
MPQRHDGNISLYRSHNNKSQNVNMSEPCVLKVLPVENQETEEDSISSKKQKTLSSDLKSLTAKFESELAALKTKSTTRK